jgi:PDGLE domain
VSGRRLFVACALALAVGLAAAVSPFASASPDGLERVAADRGFLDRGTTHAIQEQAPAADYGFPGIENERVATGLAGFAGTLAVFALMLAAGRLARRPRSHPGSG